MLSDATGLFSPASWIGQRSPDFNCRRHAENPATARKEKALLSTKEICFTRI